MKISNSYTITSGMELWRNGCYFCDLQAEEVTITMNAAAAIKTSLSCFVQGDRQLNLQGGRLRPWQAVNGQRFSMGEFIVSTPQWLDSWNRRGWQVEGYDQGVILEQATTTGRYYLPAGGGYLAAVQQILMDNGIRRATVPPTTATLPTDREWEPGVSWLSIVNTLLTEAGCQSLWFDREGVARLEPLALAGAAPNLRYAPDEYSILRDGITYTTDTFNAYNVFTVAVSSPDCPPMVAVAVNDSPASAISTVNLGRRVCAPVRYVEAVAGQQELADIAQGDMFKAMLGEETVTFETLPLPAHWYGDVVDLAGAAYRETGWDITLGFDGSYRHTAAREVAR